MLVGVGRLGLKDSGGAAVEIGVGKARKRDLSGLLSENCTPDHATDEQDGGWNQA